MQLSETAYLWSAYRRRGIEGIVRYLESSPGERIVPILKKYGASMGDNTAARGPLFIENAYGDEGSTGDFSNLVAGSNCHIGKNVTLDLSVKLLLGDEVILAMGCMILTHQDCGARQMRCFFPR